MRIREVALYQTVKVPLYENGAWVTSRPAPLIQHKRALARVFVDTLERYSPHAVRAVLTLQNGAAREELVSEHSLTRSSTDADLDSTFNFNLTAAQINADTQLSIAIEEPDCSAVTDSAGEADTRVPSSGIHALDAIPVGNLRLVVVPVEVNGRLPVVTPKDLEDVRAAIRAYYPVPDVEITVREPLTVPFGVGGVDDGLWADMLSLVARARQADKPDADVYYLGLVQPTATAAEHCESGCVLGVGIVATEVKPQAQVALTAAYFADLHADTLREIVHNLGHAHGRRHVRCSQEHVPFRVDPDFPDRLGATGVWGWDQRTNELYSPTHNDVMGYCEQTWISAYTYAALAKRSQEVNRPPQDGSPRNTP